MAIEAADVVLMDDDPMKLLKGILISKKCIAIVYENIVFALAVKFACLALGAFGVGNMWLAIFADVGVMVIAVIKRIGCTSGLFQGLRVAKVSRFGIGDGRNRSIHAVHGVDGASANVLFADSCVFYEILKQP